jgi:hypothetical protein
MHPSRLRTARPNQSRPPRDDRGEAWFRPNQQKAFLRPGAPGAAQRPAFLSRLRTNRKAAVAVAVRFPRAIFFPKQLQGQVLMLLKLAAKRWEIRCRPIIDGSSRPPRRVANSSCSNRVSSQPSGSGKPLQIARDRCLTDGAASADLILPQAEIIAKPKYLFYLPHGHLFLGHECSSTLSRGTSVPGCPAPILPKMKLSLELHCDM